MKPEKIIFHVRRHQYGKVPSFRRDTLSASITFKSHKIGHIIGGRIYLYIRSEHPALRFTPELYHVRFKDFEDAVAWVKANPGKIWEDTPKLFHPLKNKYHESSRVQGSLQGTQGLLPL